MKQKILKISDKKLFDKYLSYARHDLSVYNFANIYTWNKLYKISWSVFDDNLCIFFRDKIGCFLYLPPLGRKLSSAAVKKSFEEMNKVNKNKEISRVENIAQAELDFFSAQNLEIVPKCSEYVCDRQALAGLRGNKFKSKRSSYNYFIKNYKYDLHAYQLKYRKPCLDLFELWSAQRKLEARDKIYKGMIDDSKKCLEIILSQYKRLGISGYVVFIGKKIKAFTFGYKLNTDTFCVLYEITDLSIKGIAQFVVREFAQSLKGCKFINIMDDSCLENLKTVKLSYHPVKIIPAYIAGEKHA